MVRAILLAAALLVPSVAVSATEPTLDPRAAVERIAERIEANYFDPSTAERIASELRADAEAGRFDRLTDPRELAASLTERLQAQDAHFAVTWSPPAPWRARTTASAASRCCPATSA
jgi:hypothetical protein